MDYILFGKKHKELMAKVDAQLVIINRNINNLKRMQNVKSSRNK